MVLGEVLNELPIHTQQVVYILNLNVTVVYYKNQLMTTQTEPTKSQKLISGISHFKASKKVIV